VSKDSSVVFSHLASLMIYRRSGKAVGDDLNGCCRLVSRFWFLLSDLVTQCSLIKELCTLGGNRIFRDPVPTIGKYLLVGLTGIIIFG
jgi:hypothetical protein